MKRIPILILSLFLVLTMLPLSAFAASAETAQSTQKNDISSGRLIISEAGSYTLTGTMRGTVWVDPGAGHVELILDNVTIDGAGAPAIQAVSGERLQLTMTSGSWNTMTDGNAANAANAAVFSQIPMIFSGEGQLNINGMTSQGISAPNADIVFDSGRFSISAPNACIASTSPVQFGQNATVFENGKMTAGPAPVDAQTRPTMAEAVQRASLAYSAQNQAAPFQNNARADAGDRLSQPENSNPPEMNATARTTENGMPAAQNSVMPEQNRANTRTDRNTGAADQNSASVQPDRNTGAADQNSASARPDRSAGTAGQNSASAQPDRSAGMAGQNIPVNGQSGWNPGLSSTGSATEIVTSTVVNTAADLEADMERATSITVTEENSQVKIDTSGTYVVTGSASDGNITVKKDTDGVVLVLKDLDLTSTTGATLSINKNAEVKLVVSGNVTLTDAENPADETSADADIADAFDGAAMKFKAGSQVFLTGDGTLTLNGEAKNGIKVGDEANLMIDGGLNVNIRAANDGINANYDLTILGGSLTIEAGDDAIHADRILTIGRENGTGPEIHVTGSNEGLEGTVVNMFGGKVTIRSTDDAINAANGDGLFEGELDYSFNMTGGQVDIRSSGDGVDSNGNVNLKGGTLSIQSASAGGEAGIDYDGSLYVAQNFGLNNQSGSSGPDGMGGQMAGNMPAMNSQTSGNMPGMNGQTSGNMPGMNGQTSGNMPAMNSQASGNMPAMNGQTSGNMPAMNGQTAGNAQAGFSGQNGNMPAMSGQTSGNMPPMGAQGMQGGRGF